MFGFNHFPELIIVLAIALIVFGPKRLPELGSSLGKGIREFRKATGEFGEGLKNEPSEALPPETSYSAPTAASTTPAEPHPAEYTAEQSPEPRPVTAASDGEPRA